MEMGTKRAKMSAACKLAGMALALGGGLLVLERWAFPRWLENRLVAELERRGVANVDFHVRHVSLTACHLADIALGPDDAIRVDALRISYHPADLWNRSVGPIDVGAVRIRFPAVVSALSGLRTPEGPATAATPPSQSTALPAYPFERIRFSSVVLEAGGGPLPVLLFCAGTMTPASPGRLRVDAVLRSSAASADLLGEWGGTDAASFLNVTNLQIRLPAAAALAELALPPLAFPVPLTGSISLQQPSGGPAQLALCGELRQPIELSSGNSGAQTLCITAAASGVLRFDDAGYDLTGRIRFAEPGFRLGPVDLAWKDGGIRIALSGGANGPAKIDARAVIRDGAASAHPVWRATEIQADIPLPFQGTTSATGRIRAGSIRFRERDLGWAEGEFTLERNRADGRIRAALLDGQSITVSAKRHGTAIDVAVRTPVLDLGDQPGLTDLLRHATGLEFGGRLEAEMAYRSDGPPSPVARVTLTDVSVRKETFLLEGVSGSLRLPRLNPLQSEPHQELAIDRLVAEQVTLKNGRLQFTMHGPDHVFVERNQWDWGGGALSSHAFLYQPSQQRIRADFVAEDIDLNAVLQLAFGPQVTGTGSLYGRIPVALQWDPLRFSVEGGYLHAAPGRHRLRIQDRALADRVLDAASSSLTQTRQAEDVSDRILRSLRDFEYNVFRVELTPGPDGLPSGILHIEGEGKGDLGVPLVLDLRFRRAIGE